MQPGNSATHRLSLSREQVFEEVRRIVAEESGTSVERIGENDHLVNDLGCDSLSVIEIAMEVEEEFDITIPDDTQQEAGTVGDVVDTVVELLAEAGRQ
jgi:acyl carrier protein